MGRKGDTELFDILPTFRSLAGCPISLLLHFDKQTIGLHNVRENFNSKYGREVKFFSLLFFFSYRSRERSFEKNVSSICSACVSVCVRVILE